MSNDNIISIDSFKRYIDPDSSYIAENLIVKMAERCDNFNYFVTEGLSLNNKQKRIFEESKKEEQYYLVEEISKSNIEKAVFIMEHSNEKLIKMIKESRGNIKNFQYYDTILDMIQDLEKADTKNQEVLRAKEIIHELESRAPTYTNAFKKDNLFRKSVYFSSAMSAIYTIIKEHLLFLDVTSSKNESKIIMVKDAHYFATDADNIKNLNHNLLLVKSKLDNKSTGEQEHVKESFMAIAAGAAAGAKFIGSSIAAGFAILTNAALWSSIAAGATVFLSANVLLAAAIISIGALYVISRISAKPIADYLESYEYIKEVAKNSKLDGDKKIFRTLEKMTSMRKKLLNVWKSDKSKNISEYMKDLNKDVDIIIKSEGNKKVDNLHNKSPEVHSTPNGGFI